MIYYLLFAVLLLGRSGLLVSSSNQPVYFSLIYSGGGPGGFNSSGIIPAVDLALEAIGQLNVLPGYNLTYDAPVNSQCSRTTSLDVFFKDTDSNPIPKIAVIGCGCSAATESVAEISHHWNISQISYASPLSTLSDRTRFRNFFRMTPTFNNYALALMGLVNQFQWRRLAFITQNEGIFHTVYSDFTGLQKDLKAGTSKECCFEDYSTTTVNIVFETRGGTLSDVTDLFDSKEFHVFFVNSYFGHARRIICEASKRNMVYPNYAWIFYGLYPNRWWTEAVSNIPLEDCTDAELEKFLMDSHAIMAHIGTEPDDFDAPTAAEISSRNFTNLYLERARQTGFSPNIAIRGAFDAVWSLAEALNRTENMRIKQESSSKCNVSELPGELVPLNEFEYSNTYMGCVVKQNLQNVDFTGVTGRVRYGEDGTIVYSRIRLAQPRYVTNDQGIDVLTRVRFGYLDKDFNYSLKIEDGERVTSLYPDGAPPDGTPVDIIHTYHYWLVAVYYLLSLVGVVLAIFCFFFNFIYRNRRVIRLTSPALNHVIIGGALLMYLSAVVEFIPTTVVAVVKARCIIHIWMYGVGYLLVYGTILAKMWRVYQIFNNPTTRKKNVLTTYDLLWMVTGITGFGALLIAAETVAQAVESPHLVPDAENPYGITSSDIQERYTIWQCHGTDSAAMYLQIVIFCYLILLQILGILLAFQTRKVRISALNDAKSVTALIYISSIILVVVGLIHFFMSSYINVNAAIFSGGIILLATFFLTFIFIPKMVNLYRDPMGDRVFETRQYSAHSRSSEEQQQNDLASKLPNLTDPEKIELLKTYIVNLEENVELKSRKIKELQSSSSS